MDKFIKWLDGERGRRTSLAFRLDLEPPAVSLWVSRGRIPAEHVLEIERVTGISRYELRPDIFGNGPEADQ